MRESERARLREPASESVRHLLSGSPASEERRLRLLRVSGGARGPVGHGASESGVGLRPVTGASGLESVTSLTES